MELESDKRSVKRVVVRPIKALYWRSILTVNFSIVTLHCTTDYYTKKVEVWFGFFV